MSRKLKLHQCKYFAILIIKRGYTRHPIMVLVGEEEELVSFLIHYTSVGYPRLKKDDKRCSYSGPNHSLVGGILFAIIIQHYNRPK